MLNDAERKKQIIGAPDFEQVKQRFKENNYPFIKMMSDAGIRVITGTDCGAEASQTTPVGHTTHREVQMFVEAGMTPLNAIRAATLDAARVLERTENPSYGSIQAGKVADIVLLGADPLADIHNTNKVDRVMRAGRWVE
jgi:imidazolonepropionase-like amidohydrolase